MDIVAALYGTKLMSTAIEAYRRNGLKYVLKNGVLFSPELFLSIVMYHYYRLCRSKVTFQFQGRSYDYYYSSKGRTWRTERIVEIPIIMKFLNDILTSHENGRVLEVGNVLSSHFPVNHDILDKYEIRNGIINEDVVSYNPPFSYDLIVSISTMEHVGWDESPRDPAKLLRGIENLRRILKPFGRIVITMPIGQNQYLDGLLNENYRLFTHQYFMRRTQGTQWHECTFEGLKNISYNQKIPCANAIIIGIIEPQ